MRHFISMLFLLLAAGPVAYAIPPERGSYDTENENHKATSQAVYKAHKHNAVRATDFDIVRLKIVSRERLESGQSLIAIKLVLENNTPEELPPLEVTVFENQHGIEVLDSKAMFEGVRPFSRKRSSDTVFIVKERRSGPLFKESFEYIADIQTLSGFDEDQNGVRDDVQAGIYAQFGPETAESLPVQTLLAEAQSRLVSDLTDEQLLTSYIATSQSIRCLREMGEPSTQILGYVDVLQHNSAERIANRDANEERFSLLSATIDFQALSRPEPAINCGN